MASTNAWRPTGSKPKDLIDLDVQQFSILLGFRKPKSALVTQKKQSASVANLFPWLLLCRITVPFQQGGPMLLKRPARAWPKVPCRLETSPDPPNSDKLAIQKELARDVNRTAELPTVSAPQKLEPSSMACLKQKKLTHGDSLCDLIHFIDSFPSF